MNVIIVNGLSGRIKTLRKSRGWSQENLAHKMGLTKSAVNAWETDVSQPSLHGVIQLAQIFKVTSDFLLGLDRRECVRVAGLGEKEIDALIAVIECLESKDST